MDWQLLMQLPTGIALGAIAMYYSNQLTIKYLDERKELLQTLVAERDDWNSRYEAMLNRYDNRLTAVIEAMTAMRDQMHSLRGDVQKVFASIELRLAAIDARAKHGPGAGQHD